MSEEYTEDDLDLMKRVFRGEPIKKKTTPKQLRPQPIFKHPLPVSSRRFGHEKMLRDVSCHAADRQVLSAVTLQNAWVLEEVIMNGAPIDTRDTNGFTPLHIACRNNDFECVMVLINFGADINAVTISGITPLYMAKAAEATQVVNLLMKQNAVLEFGSHRSLPGATVLEVSVPSHNSVLNVKGECVGLPHEHTWN
mmetsp:Transcript_8875/g.13304  ORF Transcript_8875/g.13304 Transcript_8875/m.13304 type:complete len:196 (+) Transcript_8875:93-680(+)